MRRNYLQRVLDDPPPPPPKFHNKLWERAAQIAREVDMVMDYRSDIPAGLQLLTGNQTITTATISSAVSQGYVGIYLDPRYVYTVTASLVIDGISNFTIESRMVGSLGTGNPTTIVSPTGYIKTDIAQQAISSTTNGTTTVTSAALFGTVTVGMRVTGTGTTSGTYVTAVASSSSITVNQSITAGTPTLTFSSDGIQVYGPSSGTTTNGIVLRGVAIIGNNPGAAVVHNGGNQRGCAQYDCFIYNSTANTNANSYGFLNDSALANGPAEDFFAQQCIWIGPRAYGLDVDSVISGHANDSLYVNLQTQSTGDYSIYATGGGNHEFTNWYDRSNPTAANVFNSGAVLYFNGGETENPTGNNHVCSGGKTILQRRTETWTSPQVQTTVVVSGGQFIVNDCAINGGASFTVSSGTLAFRGQSSFGSSGGGVTVTISSTGIADFSDPHVNGTNCTIAGSAGTLYLPTRIGPATYPTITFTGQSLGYVVAHKRSLSTSATQTLSWTPPASNCTVRVNIVIRVITHSTSTIPNIGFTDLGGVVVSFVPAIWRFNGVATAPQYTIGATGLYTANLTLTTDASATAIITTITPTGDTYAYDITYELLSTGA